MSDKQEIEREIVELAASVALYCTSLLKLHGVAVHDFRFEEAPGDVRSAAGHVRRILRRCNLEVNVAEEFENPDDILRVLSGSLVMEIKDSLAAKYSRRLEVFFDFAFLTSTLASANAALKAGDNPELKHSLEGGSISNAC